VADVVTIGALNIAERDNSVPIRIWSAGRVSLDVQMRKPQRIIVSAGENPKKNFYKVYVQTQKYNPRRVRAEQTRCSGEN